MNPASLFLQAAAELQTRLEPLVGPRQKRRLTVGTFHSVAASMLRKCIAELEAPGGPGGGPGRTSDFAIFDEDDCKTLLKDWIKATNPFGRQEKAQPSGATAAKASSARPPFQAPPCGACLSY
jgi:superfamily I DNA/RNA helicase